LTLSVLLVVYQCKTVIIMVQRFNKTFKGWQNLWNFRSFEPCCSYLPQTHNALRKMHHVCTRVARV